MLCCAQALWQLDDRLAFQLGFHFPKEQEVLAEIGHRGKMNKLRASAPHTHTTYKISNTRSNCPTVLQNVFETTTIFLPPPESLTSFYCNTWTPHLRHSSGLGEYHNPFSVFTLLDASSTSDTSEIFDYPFPEEPPDFPPNITIG